MRGIEISYLSNYLIIKLYFAMRERNFICIVADAVRNFAANTNISIVMKLTNILTIVMLAALPAVASCSSSINGTKSERTVTITKPYSGISASSGIVVNYAATASAESSTVCVVSGHHEIVDRVKIDVTDGMLYIRVRNWHGIGPASAWPVVVTVSGRPVSRFKASSGSAINVGSALKTNGKFLGDVSSGGAVNLSKKIACSSFIVDMSSGGTIDAETIEALTNIVVDGSSGGMFTCSDVTCNALEIDMSSGAITNLAGTAKSCEVDASSGAVVRISKVEVETPIEVDASSGAIVEIGSGSGGISSSGAIIKRK